MPPLNLPVLQRTYLDNSILESLARCPRLCFYNYVLCRASRGINFPIQYGVAYHKFREILERLYIEWVGIGKEKLEDVKDFLYTPASAVALQGWTDPPLEHAKSYLDETRLTKAFKLSFDRWLLEKEHGQYVIIGTETGFSLPLPSGRIFAGRLDQALLWNNRQWIRDFKTVGRKPKSWKKKFSPNHQFTGYSWAQSQLSNRAVEGVIVDVVYNIKSTGPKFYPTMIARTTDDIRNWLVWVEDEYDNYERYVENGKWPMKTSACDDYGGCYFKECCDGGSWSSVESWLLEKTIHSEWDPLNPDKEEGLPE